MGPRPIRGLSLCTGIAGIELGLHLALPDYRTDCAVEWDTYAQSILIARQADGTFEPFPIWDDVTTFDGREWRGQVDILSAGYPCQPFSLAGKRAGVDDPRHLWPHVARIIGECQPALVFLENVPGHLSLGFPDVGMELCALGYGFEAGLFSAAEVGSSHNRERMFVLAYAGRRGQHALESFGFGGRCGSSVTGEAGPAVAHAHGERLAERELAEVAGGAGWVAGSSFALAHPTSDLRRALRDDRRAPSDGAGDSDDVADAAELLGDGCDYQSGCPIPESRDDSCPLFPPSPSDADTWRAVLERWPDLAPATEAQAKSSVRGVADGLPRRVDQLKALGNAVVPLVAAHAFRTLRDRLERG